MKYVIFCFLFLISIFTKGQSIDSSFNTIGAHKLNFSIFENAQLAIQSNQNLLFAGQYDSNNVAIIFPSFRIVKLTSNGFIDPLFGNNGELITTLNFDSTFFQLPLVKYVNIAVQSNDKFIVSAFFGKGTLAPNDNKLIWMRFNTDGSIDNSFGNNGLVITNGFKFYTPIKIKVLPNDDLLFLMNSTLNKNVLIKTNSLGKIDSSFGINGIASYNLNGNSRPSDIEIQTDGKIVICGSNNNKNLITRFNSNGLIDSSFGINGNQITDFLAVNTPNAIEIQTDGKILIAGTTGDSTGDGFGSCWGYNTFGFAQRFLPNGNIDSSFNQNSFIERHNYISAFPYNLITFKGVHIYGNKILVTGFIQKAVNEVSHFLASYNLNGSVDSSFGSNGLYIYTESGIINMTENSQMQNPNQVLLDGITKTVPFNGVNKHVARYILDLNLGIIDKNEEEKTNVLLYPNPINDIAHVEYSLLKKQNITIQLRNVEGKIVQIFKEKENQPQGNYKIELDFSNNITSGLYFLEITGERFKNNIKLYKN